MDVLGAADKKELIVFQTVIHIGFLSSEKNTFSGPKNFTPMKPRRAFGFLVLRFVLPLDTNVSRRPGSIVLFRSCEFTMDSLIESTCRKQTALSCSHPSGSGPRSFPSVTEAPDPIPTPSGPEQRQYRTLFMKGCLLSSNIFSFSLSFVFFKQAFAM